MKKAYLFVYTDTLGTREEIKNCLNSIGLIIYWRYDMPNTFYLISKYSASEISKAIRKYFNKGRYIVSEITENKNGYLPSKSWYLINNKEREG